MSFDRPHSDTEMEDASSDPCPQRTGVHNQEAYIMDEAVPRQLSEPERSQLVLWLKTLPDKNKYYIWILVLAEHPEFAPALKEWSELPSYVFGLGETTVWHIYNYTRRYMKIHGESAALSRSAPSNQEEAGKLVVYGVYVQRPQSYGKSKEPGHNQGQFLSLREANEFLSTVVDPRIGSEESTSAETSRFAQPSAEGQPRHIAGLYKGNSSVISKFCAIEAWVEVDYELSLPSLAPVSSATRTLFRVSMFRPPEHGNRVELELLRTFTSLSDAVKFGRGLVDLHSIEVSNHPVSTKSAQFVPTSHIGYILEQQANGMIALFGRNIKATERFPAGCEVKVVIQKTEQKVASLREGQCTVYMVKENLEDGKETVVGLFRTVESAEKRVLNMLESRKRDSSAEDVDKFLIKRDRQGSLFVAAEGKVKPWLKVLDLAVEG